MAELYITENGALRPELYSRVPYWKTRILSDGHPKEYTLHIHSNSRRFDTANFAEKGVY